MPKEELPNRNDSRSYRDDSQDGRDVKGYMLQLAHGLLVSTGFAEA